MKNAMRACWFAAAWSLVIATASVAAPPNWNREAWRNLPVQDGGRY
jgi:hypothetical protein